MKVVDIIKNIWFKTSIIVLISFLCAVFIKHEVLSFSEISPLERNVDFRASDLYAASLHNSPVHRKNEDITIISANNCTREEIYKCTELLLRFSPSVVAFDIIFEFPHPADSLVPPILNNDNIVFASYLVDVDSSADAAGIDQSYFHAYNQYKTGVINLTSTTSNVIREFKPLFTLNDNVLYNCFAGEIVRLYNPSKFVKLMDINEDIVPIAYHKVDFDVVSLKQILNEGFQHQVLKTMIKDKIVIIGVTNDPSDQFDTPIEHNYPGVLIHANIIDTILQENYITDSSNWANYIISILLSFVFMILFLHLKEYVDELSGIIMRIVQILILFILYYLGIRLYNNNVYMNCLLPMLTIAFSSIITDIYLGVEHLTIKYGLVWVNRLKELL